MKTIMTFFRLLYTGFVLARHDALIPAEYAKSVPWFVRFVGWVSRLFSRRLKNKNPGERLAIALEKLGPAYIKFGQILATRSDMLDEDFIRGLSRLKDNVPPFSMQEAEARLQKDFGKPWAEIFKTFSEPVAAASVAQVHKAELLSGEIVAVKILRPNIHRQMEKDISVLRMVAGFTQKFVKSLDRLKPVLFIETVARSVSLELDLRLEAAAASEISEIATDTDLFRVPNLHWDLSSKNIMVMEWIDGTSLSSENILALPEADKKALAIKIIQSFLASAFDYGVFHADMHEGNLILDEAGQLVLLDFGILGRLSVAEQRFHAEILFGFLERDYHRIAEIHFEAGYVSKTHTLEDFASALRAVGEPIFGKTSDQVSMANVLLHLFEITEIFDMQMQPQLIMLQKTMMQAEGVARRLDTAFDMWEAARPIVEASLRRELGPEGRIGDFMADLRLAQKTLKAMPEAAENVAALAKAWRAGDVDLSKPLQTPSLTKSKPVLKSIAWAGGGAVIMYIGLWAVGQI
ncbi:MAG: 2-polyprenylphenol 6-hydroxylase [Robiginitomaculum sp.]|nr:2-polyprenylphenol 6-hydroxylase [Robiginitomaculum sp.]